MIWKARTYVNAGAVDSSNHVDETYLVGQKDATCIETGYTGDVYCSSCDNMISVGTETPLAEHTYGEWVETTKPTCTEEGEREAFCEECGVRFTEPVPATGHTAGEWEITTPATCTEDGVRTTTCMVCGVEYTEVIPATGHQYGAWTVVKEATETEQGLRERVCSVCGEKESEVIFRSLRQKKRKLLKPQSHQPMVQQAAIQIPRARRQVLKQVL